MPQNVARHSLNVFQDYVAEYGFPDVMSTALVLVLLMERTVKERALRSVIVRRPVIQLLTAVGTVHQPEKMLLRPVRVLRCRCWRTCCTFSNTASSMMASCVLGKMACFSRGLSRCFLSQMELV